MPYKAFFRCCGLLVLITTAILAVGPAAFAQNSCSANTLAGVYSMTCTGSVLLSPDPTAPMVPYAAQGTVTNTMEDGKTLSVGESDQSWGGIPLRIKNVADDTLKIKSDCTGTVVYSQEIIGNPLGVDLPPLQSADISFEVLDQGKEMRSILTNPGMTITCNLKLMRRNVE